jgi:predicted membrane-bound spermidine synthase
LNRNLLLLSLVFIAGAASLGIELTASRLIGPFFGTSVLIWAILIGMTLIYLTIGYYIGGRLADHSPHATTLYQIVAWAGFFVGLIPFIGRPILFFSLQGFASYDAAILFSTLVGINLIFAAPMMLLGMVSPFAIRLAIGESQTVGGRVGVILALSTLGSLVGNFGTAFWLEPRIGTHNTFFVAALLLFVVALVDMWRAQRASLRLLIFAAGVSTLAVELAASRLIGPYYGTAIEIWSVVIGLTLICLTIGYEVGGRLADRSPREATLHTLAIIASVCVAIIPFIASPILRATQQATIGMGAFYGAFSAFICLFAVPLILFGALSPFAVRLTVREASHSGSKAGSLYALSTLGSILGTFVPVLLLVPTIGTRNTFLVFAFALLAVSLVGLWRNSRTTMRQLLTLPCIIGLLALFAPAGSIKPLEEQGKTTLYETESLYNYIRVMKYNAYDFTILELNEGQAIHSLYSATNLLSGGVWDYFLVAPYFANNVKPAELKSLALIGSAAGTVAKQYTRVYGSIQIDGAEIDPAIIDVGRAYFAMTDPNFNVYAQDGRYFLRNARRAYDIVAVDAYRPPYIPFHLTTREFFTEIKDHLNDNGILVINAGHTLSDYGLVNVLAATMKDVFPNVYVLDVPTRGSAVGNSLVIATKQATKIENFKTNIAQTKNETLQLIADSAENVREVKDSIVEGRRVVFTDDHAPVEEVVHRILINFILTGR